MKLKNLKKVPFEIATLLASNDTIVKLLCNDSPMVLAMKDIFKKSVAELIEENYINFYPAAETGINDIDRNTFIIINIENFDVTITDSNTVATGAVFVTTDKAHCLLNNNSLRLLELCDEIETTLENQKLSSAGSLQLEGIHYVVFSDFRSGYRIDFRCTDQNNRKAEL